MVQSIVCRACGADVPYGRLSCADCGELLASVAGPGRGRQSTASAPASGADDHPAEGLPPPADSEGFLDIDAARDRVPLVPSPQRSRTTAGPVAAATSGPGSATLAMPGAWLPPVLDAAGPSAPARAWAGHGGAGSASRGTSDPVSGPAAEAGDAPSSLVTGPFAGASEFVAWLAIAGSALAIVGFVLPWSSISVIGASGVGYFDRWGLAGAGHPLIFVAILGVLAAAVLRERIPIWFGIGLPGIGLGALMVGLAWPYLVGPLAGQLGVMAVALGALLLIGAGVATLVVDRHSRGGPPV